MDITKEFILQCEKAVEIQELYPRAPFLWDNPIYFEKGEYNSIYQYKHKFNVWLPSQSQLQEIISENFGGLTAMQLIDILNDWINSLTFNKYPDNLGYSMEQIWLGIAMETLYSKIWNGKVWEKK